MREGAVSGKVHNRFFLVGAGALGVERQRTGLKLGSGSKPALELPWWKRGNVCGSVTIYIGSGGGFSEELNTILGVSLVPDPASIYWECLLL